MYHVLYMYVRVLPSEAEGGRLVVVTDPGFWKGEGTCMQLLHMQNYLIAVCCVSHSTLTRSLYHLLSFT